MSDRRTASPVDDLVAETLQLLVPPPRLSLADWAEQEFRLPERSSAQPGRFRLWKYQRGWLDAIGDRTKTRVTIIKAARTGFTKCLGATIGSYAANDPCSIILLVPTDDDTRRYAVDEIEPSFEETPALRNVMRRGRADGRNTLTMKSFLGGGSLKILAARSPRNLRAHDAKVLLIDEADAMEVTAEGDPISLAEKRTMAHPDRKIVVGSTPTIEGISAVDRNYAESDQRVFEIPCPHCGAFFEPLWNMIKWPPGEPEKAALACPECGELIDERNKPAMVEAGQWRATRPEVTDHAGFRISALVSLFANASWGKLALEYLKAHRAGPTEMQVFVNTVEGRVWKQSLDSVDAGTLIARAEDFSLEAIPAEVLAITAGVDVQDDRLEITFLGWSDQNVPWALGHTVIWGSTLEPETWLELDETLSTKWRHANGWLLGVDAAAIDSGGSEGRTQKVYDFCATRLHRRIYAVKGMAGARRIWQPSVSKKEGVRIFICGVDGLKTEVMERLAAKPFVNADGEPIEDWIHGAERNPHGFRLSAHLPEEWFEQVTNERRIIRYVRNRPVIEFKPVVAGKRVEGLDCTVYALACRQGVRIDFEERAKRTGEQPRPRRTLSDLKKMRGQ